MCMGGNIGAKINTPINYNNIYEYLFGEDQSRYLIEIDKNNLDKIKEIMNKNNVFYEVIANTQCEKFEVNKEFSVCLDELKNVNYGWFDKYIET